MIQCELLPQPFFALAQRGHAPPHRGHMLADVQVQALNERCGDPPATCGSHLLNGLKRAEHYTVRDVDQPPAPHGLDHLGVQ
jgi:hypothetical protein